MGAKAERWVAVLLLLLLCAILLLLLLLLGRVRRSLEQRHPWMAGASPSGATMDGRGVAVAFACDLAM